ncbi:10086_t:CDS:2 [Paraglomus occultum]|uniref:10086_t:CDS:1 n=1 Tax=Paraglomus occultum TaxID=144539 RepID=A0A9N9FVM6_9GLOM|nr:10086_t:CDS:2 [Paraglomus occultum]
MSPNYRDTSNPSMVESVVTAKKPLIQSNHNTIEKTKPKNYVYGNRPKRTPNKSKENGQNSAKHDKTKRQGVSNNDYKNTTSICKHYRIIRTSYETEKHNQQQKTTESNTTITRKIDYSRSDFEANDGIDDVGMRCFCWNTTVFVSL